MKCIKNTKKNQSNKEIIHKNKPHLSWGSVSTLNMAAHPLTYSLTHKLQLELEKKIHSSSQSEVLHVWRKDEVNSSLDKLKEFQLLGKNCLTPRISFGSQRTLIFNSFSTLDPGWFDHQVADAATDQ